MSDKLTITVCVVWMLAGIIGGLLGSAGWQTWIVGATLLAAIKNI